MPRKVNLPPEEVSRWRHWPLAAILAIAAVLLFTSLQRDYLWSDEGDTAVLARSILKYGVPTAWDGTTFTDSDFGARLTDDFVMVSSPWLQYYVTAASFAVFGESAFAARVPFALSGLLTIALVYVLVIRATRNHWTAATAAALLTLSVQFLIFARMSRHYTLNAALTCLLILQFTSLRSWADALRLSAIGILLFHSHPIGLAAFGALGAVCFVHREYRAQWRWYWRSAAVTALFTLPWLLLAKSGYEENTGLLEDFSVFLPRIGQYLIEVASVTSLLGSIVLLGVLRRRKSSALTTDERGLIAPLVAVVAAYAIAMAITQPRDVMWTIGVRYTPAVLPFMAIVAAISIARVSRFQWKPWLALFLVFGFTKAARLTPWTFWDEPTATRNPSSAVTFHIPERGIDRVLRTGQVAFLESLAQPNPGTTSRVVEYLRQHAETEDVVVTNYGWEPLYFHTGLRQGMTVLPSYPIYPAARDKQLPDYVFSPEGARWIVWRRAWGPYRGQRLDQILSDLAERRIPVALAAAVPETLWENRENLHFRRYPGNRYIYPWFEQVPDTLIFRVDWPAGTDRQKSG